MENSKIQWTTHTFNPWIGCTRVSPGCQHCYAETLMDTRYGRVKWGPDQPRSLTSTSYWRNPVRWNRQAENTGERLRVFPSLCDVFDHEVPSLWKDDFHELIAETPHLDWLLLTKRHKEMLVEMTERYGDSPPDNLWLGVSVENQEWADKRRASLRAVAAATKFVSYEPAIGPVDWSGWDFVHWMIVGGESGPGSRRFDSMWAADALDWCRAYGVAFFMKQKGSNSDVACRDAKGGDPSEWPEWCRVREFPGGPRLLCV